MEVGSLLVGIAVATVVVAYLARPFRRAYSPSSLDFTIETWVVEARQGEEWVDEVDSEPYASAQAAEHSHSAGDEGEVNFCTKCGRRAELEDLFCAKCGAKLREA